MRVIGAIVGMLIAFPAYAFDPCFGAREIANRSFNASIQSHADTQAKIEGLSGDAFSARAEALRLSPTAEIQAQAQSDQAAAVSAKAACEAAALKSPRQ